MDRDLLLSHAVGGRTVVLGRVFRSTLCEGRARSEPLPIIMDDVFVNFDDDRNDQMIDRVQQFAKSRQVIILTCHQRTLEAYSSGGANSITF